MKHKILISDKFDPEGIKKLKKESSFDVLYDNGYKREEFLKLLPEANGLIIRSATKVDAEALSVAKNLKLIIRAGVGVDNIDIPAASRKGIIVMNSPGGNSVSTAELAISLMCSLARNIAQSNMSMKANKWEKSRFSGVEMTGKTLGVVGLGRIGKEVVSRARALKMNVIGFDPYIPSETLESLGIPIVTREEILSKSDFLTVHTPLTDSTKNFVSMENLSKLKDGIRLINCARGGIYDENALVEGLKSGKIGGVALDVFSEEPPPENYPLRELENCIMTPHLGASTGDAEFQVAMDTISQMIDFFTKGTANFALNFPSLDPATMEFLEPYIRGGEKTGKLLSSLCKGDLKKIEIKFFGDITGTHTQPVVTSILRGALMLSMGDEVNSVNAPYIARDRGIDVSKSEHKTKGGFENSVQVIFTDNSSKDYEITFTSLSHEPLVVSLMNTLTEFKPDGILLIIENKDVPKVVGMTGMFLGDQDINIARMEMSRDSRGGTARCVITIDDLLSPDAIKKIQGMENILSAVAIDLR